MATNREKQLVIILLKERIEHATGKKVILKEGFAVQTPSPKQGQDPMFEENILQRAGQAIKNVFTPIEQQVHDLAIKILTKLKEQGKNISPQTMTNYLRNYFKGKISEIIIQNKILRASDIIALLSKEDSPGLNLAENKILEEKWESEVEVSKKEKGKYDGWTLEKLRSAADRLKKKENKTKTETGKLRELNFAIRAKQKDQWGKVEEGEELEEKALSKKQQRFFGIVDAMRKGEMKPQGKAGKVASGKMSTSDIKDFASTKHKGLPNKVGEDKNQTQLDLKENKQIATNREKQLTALLLKERLERLTGKKVILEDKQLLKEERVTIDQMNNILSNVPPQEKIALYMITKVNMNKNYIDPTDGQKKPNPFYDKVIKKNTVYGRVNYNYGEEFSKNTGEIYFPTDRSLGEKQGAIVIKDGRARLPLIDIEYDTPEYEINGNEISKEELTPYLKPASPSQQTGTVKMIAPYLDNVKKIVIGSKEYQLM